MRFILYLIFSYLQPINVIEMQFYFPTLPCSLTKYTCLVTTRIFIWFRRENKGFHIHTKSAIHFWITEYRIRDPCSWWPLCFSVAGVSEVWGPAHSVLCQEPARTPGPAFVSRWVESRLGDCSSNKRWHFVSENICSLENMFNRAGNGGFAKFSQRQ